jgi:hypothetical protein
MEAPRFTINRVHQGARGVWESAIELRFGGQREFDNVKQFDLNRLKVSVFNSLLAVISAPGFENC